MPGSLTVPLLHEGVIGHDERDRVVGQLAAAAFARHGLLEGRVRHARGRAPIGEHQGRHHGRLAWVVRRTATSALCQRGSEAAALWGASGRGVDPGQRAAVGRLEALLTTLRRPSPPRRTATRPGRRVSEVRGRS